LEDVANANQASDEARLISQIESFAHCVIFKSLFQNLQYIKKQFGKLNMKKYLV